MDCPSKTSIFFAVLIDGNASSPATPIPTATSRLSMRVPHGRVALSARAYPNCVSAAGVICRCLRTSEWRQPPPALLPPSVGGTQLVGAQLDRCNADIPEDDVTQVLAAGELQCVGACGERENIDHRRGGRTPGLPAGGLASHPNVP